MKALQERLHHKPDFKHYRLVTDNLKKKRIGNNSVKDLEDEDIYEDFEKVN